MRDYEYIQRRIERTEQIIEAYENAIEALSTNAVSYTLDTGQSRQQVTRAQLGEMRIVLRDQENRRGRLIRERDGGGGPVVGVPSY